MTAVKFLFFTTQNPAVIERFLKAMSPFKLTKSEATNKYFVLFYIHWPKIFPDKRFGHCAMTLFSGKYTEEDHSTMTEMFGIKKFRLVHVEKYTE